jgi:hypothetical protein
MIENVKIKGLEIRSGTSKKGRGYNMVILETEGGKMSMYLDKEWGERKLKIVDTWKEGDTITVDVSQDGEYLNFDIPSKTDLLSERVFELEGKIQVLEEAVKKLVQHAKKTK